VATLGRDELVLRPGGCCRRSCVALAWLLLGLGLATSARAQTVKDAPRVATFVDPCVPIDQEHFHRVLAIELGTSLDFASGNAEEPPATVVRVGCSSAGIELALHDSVTRKAMQRSLELPAVERPMRARLLALAVAEFVVASWIELRLSPPPLEPLGPRAPARAAAQAKKIAQTRLPVRPPERDSEDAGGGRWLLGASAGALAFSQGGLMGQVSLHGEQRPSRHIALGLGVSVAHGSWNVLWGDAVGAIARLTSTSGKLGFSYVASTPRVELLAGAGVRFGLVHFAGESAQHSLRASEFYAPWGGPLLQLSAAVRWGGLRLGIDLELGYVTLRVEALIAGGPIAQIAGVWGHAGVLAAWVF